MPSLLKPVNHVPYRPRSDLQLCALDVHAHALHIAARRARAANCHAPGPCRLHRGAAPMTTLEQIKNLLQRVGSGEDAKWQSVRSK
jgi:hypothetical protein